MWLTNALANLFSYVDRYVILHHCGLDEDAALALVGNYHTARVLPLLMSSVAVTVAGAMLPHLSHDWESGRRRQVGERTLLTLKLFSAGLTLGGLAVLVAAPLLFGFAFRGKFTAGQEVLNWTLACGVWVGLQAAVYNFLWCAERPRLVSLAILGGLLLNVALNFFLVPRYGLAGAVWGTSAANLSVLLMVIGLSALVGLKVDAPAGGVGPAAAAVPAAVGGCGRCLRGGRHRLPHGAIVFCRGEATAKACRRGLLAEDSGTR